MDKDRLLAALGAVQDSEDFGEFHDELATIITLIVNASDDVVASAWNDLSNDTE